jgi:hypothetical protein
MKRNEIIAAAVIGAALIVWALEKRGCACGKFVAIRSDIPQGAKTEANRLLPIIEDMRADFGPITPRNSRVQNWGTSQAPRWLIFVKERHNDGPDGPRPYDHPGVTVYDCTEC